MMYNKYMLLQYFGNFIWANGKLGQYMSIGLSKINQHLVIYYFFQRKKSLTANYTYQLLNPNINIVLERYHKRRILNSIRLNGMIV